MGILFTKVQGNILTTLMGNVLTEGMGKVLDIYNNNIYCIVTGGGGDPLRDQARTSPYSQLFIKTYHFCKISLINNKLIIEIYDIDLNLIDQFTVN